MGRKVVGGLVTFITIYFVLHFPRPAEGFLLYRITALSGDLEEGNILAKTIIKKRGGTSQCMVFTESF